MMQRKLAVCGFMSLLCVTLTVLPRRTQAIFLDKDGNMSLGVRAYVNARVGTEQTDKSIIKDESGFTLLDSQTFPLSAAGHVRQNRAFIEIKLKHNLDRLVKEGAGPLALINQLPFKIRGLKYYLTFRGEGEGIYDWGPREFSTADQYIIPGPGVNPDEVTLASNPIAAPRGPGGVCPVSSADPQCRRVVDVLEARRNLRKFGTDRERLFEAFVEGSVGDLFVRVGRQILSWGETDGFRLLDQINPIDSSFGGFLISLDERRVPLDMLRVQYNLGDFGPVTDSYVEMYGAIDNKVGFSPGTPAGSPWTLPNLGKPSATTETFVVTPKRTFRDIRGGGRVVWNMYDATFSLAHYYTYFDTPALQVLVPRGFPLATFSDGYSAHAYESAPLVQVSGGTTTFALPQFYTIVRSELAYFKDEPHFRQSRIDPFVFHGYSTSDITTGGRELGDSINYVLGFDINRYIRFLNPNQTFLISTQLFYKHLFQYTTRGTTPFENTNVFEGEVLPVPEKNIAPAGSPALGAVEPSFIHEPQDQLLQTLFIGTSYRSGTVNPGFTLFYDWSGSIVYQPAIQFQHDPWRFEMSYSILDAGRLKGASGTSLLRDRDNIEFKFEYAI
jgi:Protein of unknown function (DUF1302)